MLGPCAMIVAQGLLRIFAKQSGAARGRGVAHELDNVVNTPAAL
ncbi:hypothetical protein BPSG_1418 [Bifidobacterium pseudolongum subsp. globosum]|nr:hypothetical protein BPSG_1418 [Bifidobacterium pseudolongum subsp. globosum]